jgi:hypothetical protein
MPTPCEDLATKAELQELRDQLNHLLGEKEDGSHENLFEKGKDKVLVGGAGLLTLLGLAKTVAPNAITEFVLEGAATNVIHADFAKGNTQLKAVKGNGVKAPVIPINQVAKTAGMGVAGTEAAVAVGATGVQAASLYGGLAAIAASLGLNKATVDIFDNRINQEAAATQAALDAQNASMLRLYNKHQGDIEAVNNEIEINNQIAAQNQQAITIIQADMLQQNLEIGTFNSKLNAAQQTINQLQADNNQHIQRINDLSEELVETKTNLTNQVNTLNAQLLDAVKVIEAQRLEILKLEEIVSLQQARITELELTLNEYVNYTDQLRNDFEALRADLDVIKELNPGLITSEATEEELHFSKVTYYETAKDTYERLFEEHRLGGENRKKWSNIVQYELASEIAEREIKYAIQARKHGFASAASQVASTQTGALQLADKLAQPDPLAPPVPTEITREDVINNPETFQERMQALLERVVPDVSPEILEDFKTGIDTKFANLNNLMTASVLPRLDDIAEGVSEPRIAQGVQTGICRSLNGGSCPGSPVQGLQGMNRATQGKLDGLNALLSGAGILQNTALGKAVDSINRTVHHKDYGLQKIQSFASKAWEVTQADKVLNIVNTGLNIHNAIMLSNNLGRSMAYIADNTLAAFGIKDAVTGLPINIGGLVKNKLNAMINQVLGVTQANALRRQFAQYNRIYQAGANVLYSVRSIMDSTYDIAETTGENVSQIGNALKKAGAVRENAYKLMPTDFRSPNRVQRKLEKFGNAVDTIEQISSDALDVTQEYKEMKSNQKEFDKELEKAIATQSKDEDSKKKEAISNPEHKSEDEIRALPKEG